MKNNVVLLALILVALSGTAQTLRINATRLVDSVQAKTWMASRGYQLLSGFDTVWKTPLRVYAWYMKENKWGIVDINGKEITPALYDEIEGLNQSYTSVMLSFHDHYPVRIGNRYGWIRNDGKVMSTVSYQGVRYGDYDVVSGQRGFAKDKSLRIEEGESDRHVTPQNQAYTPKPEQQEARYSAPPADSKWPNQTKHGTIYIRTGLPTVVVELRTAAGPRYGVVDLKKDELLYPLECSSLGYDSWNRRFIGKRGSDLVFLDSAGRSLPTDGATDIRPFNGLYMFYRGKKIALRNSKLESVTGYEFDQMGSGNGECMVLFTENKCGIYAVPSGKQILPVRFERVDMVENKSAGKIQYFYAKEGGFWGVYDRTGKRILAPQFRSIQSVSELSSRGGGGGGDVAPELGSYFWESNPYFLALDSAGKRWLLSKRFQPAALPAADEVLPMNESEWLMIGKRDTSVGKRAPLRWGIYNWQKAAWVFEPRFVERPELMAGVLVRVSDKSGSYGLWDLRQARWLMPMQQQISFSVDRVHQGLYMVFARNGRWWLDSYGNRAVVERR
jgi:hypothetical protein